MRFAIEEAHRITEKYGTRDCFHYRDRIFRAHEYMCLALARKYERTARMKGHVEANLELGRLHEKLTLGKRFHGLFIDSPDEDVKQFAEQKSLEIQRVFSHYCKRKGLKQGLEKVISLVEECDLIFPLSNPSTASEENIATAVARCCCPDWWRRQIRRRQDLTLEHVQIELGLVNKNKGIYASNNCVERKLSQWRRNEALLALLEAENDLGQIFNLLDIVKSGISDLVNRRNEMMTRIDGFEKVANERGDKGVFITITAPSKYHNHTSKHSKPNPKYNGATPKDTNDKLNKVWQRIRAKLHREGITPYGVRVVEPHHDGTPHWHILLFMPEQQISKVIAIIKHYALQEDGTEPGAKKRRVKVERIKKEKGSAASYIAKYISKGLDGENVGEDLEGFDAVQSATRIRAWASTWGTRQFQFIGGPSVTVWREARRFARSELAELILNKIGDEKLKQIFEAADTGDWKAFVELNGGPTVARKDQLLRAHHIPRATPNKYGEITKKLLGIIYQGCQAIRTKIREWTIRLTDVSKDNVFDECFSVGGANAPPLEFCQ